ncbi:MAG: cellobiose phosphorylase, partial [Candidatus Omnitrophica bacterium]|nr:cellobiose phosphorylase [Candidatus Omnitrophota bacterium]
MNKKISPKKPRYYLDKDGQFVIENYNHARPFANFFPGIAGPYGIPMWVFYVNRGQAISCFGTKDKDHAILEFHPANKAWQHTSLLGYRTFIKVLSGGKYLLYEPFHNGFTNLQFSLSNRMLISSCGLRIEERNLSLGLEVKVQYFTVPQDSYAALVRAVTIKNSSKKKKELQLLDGLPQIVPFGMNNFLLKELSRTLEAWITVENMDRGVPFYKLAVDPADKPEVIHIAEGNFFLAFHQKNKSPEILRPIIEPENIFGPVTDYSYPLEFMASNKFLPPKDTACRGKTPCAFLFSNVALGVNEEKTFYSLSGYLRSCRALNDLVPKIIKPGYLEEKLLKNKGIIDQLEQAVDTKSGSPQFDYYVRQTYLDNILRGGYPVSFGGTTFYLYSRKHGDLERDYNRFSIQPTYLSQGNGNYRDVNQNRRSDVWFNPDIGDENIVSFFNLLQLDGFNPLIVKGVNFIHKNPQELKQALKGTVPEKDLERLFDFLKKEFTPGELIIFLQENGIKIKSGFDELLSLILPTCQKNQDAEHGEGFWTDHWTYNLDLIESFLEVYPEKLDELVFHKRVFTYFDNLETVRPREEKYVLYNGVPRQLHSVSIDPHKKELIRKRISSPHVVRTGLGTGDIYRTTLINKLICLAVNKIASLDPFGIGIEMEANKPNWYDALNGLPALFGSSTCETFELKRLVLFIISVLENCQTDKIGVTEEVYDFLAKIEVAIREYMESGKQEKEFDFWDKSNSLKESFRHKVIPGVSGNETQSSVAELLAFFGNALKKIDLGLEKARDKKEGLYYSYFINEPVEYQISKPPFIKPKKFTQKRLPYFLESQMHAMRISDNNKEAASLYRAVKKSGLFDKKLKSYKVCTSLSSMPEEIGRCRVFTPGWLENESIWLHMEYKYLLEVLKQGLYEEFDSDFKNCLIPFLKPEKYGRSILENSSFLVSSAFPDDSLRGNGYVARLSGSTAEFMQMWLLMNIGKGAFFLNERKELTLRFNPSLPGWLFNRKDNSYSFKFLGKISVIYHNPSRK